MTTRAMTWRGLSSLTSGERLTAHKLIMSGRTIVADVTGVDFPTLVIEEVGSRLPVGLAQLGMK